MAERFFKDDSILTQESVELDGNPAIAIVCDGSAEVILTAPEMASFLKFQNSLVTPEMVKAAVQKSELGGIAQSEMAGAFSLIEEIFTVMYEEMTKCQQSKN